MYVAASLRTSTSLRIDATASSEAADGPRLTSLERGSGMEHPRVEPLRVTESFMTVDEVQSLLGIGRTAVYRLVRSEGFPSVRVGRAIRIPPSALHQWIHRGGSAPTEG